MTGTSPVAGRTRFREIEIELAEQTPDAFLDEVVRTFRKAGAEPTRAESKIARVLGAAAAEPPDVPDGLSLGSKATVEALVRSAFVRCLQQLLAFDPVIRLSDDVEAVHKARVATRRLRSDLRTLRPVLDRDWSEPLRGELKWLGSVLGEVRDADVLLAALEREGAQLPDEHRDAVAQLAAPAANGTITGSRRAAACARLQSLRATVGSTRRGCRVPSLRDETDRDRRAAGVVKRLAAKPRKRFRKHMRGVDGQPSDADLHEGRKRAKQVRYAYELVAPIAGKKATNAAARFEGVQEVLGDHQDAVVARAWLADAARMPSRTRRRSPRVSSPACSSPTKTRLASGGSPPAHTV